MGEESSQGGAGSGGRKQPQALRAASIEELNRMSKGTLMEALGIEFTGCGPDFVQARMPIDERTRQIHGVLHGGASAALAETLGSVGAHLALDSGPARCAGIEINANHLASASSGWANGVARPLRLGRTIQVWEIRISDDDGRLLCASRLTVAVATAPTR